MNIEVTQLVGNILPNAKIGRIILESKTRPDNIIDDPHIESDLENKITYSNGSDNDTLSKMVVSIDIVLKDLPQENNASSWSTNPDFNKFLKCRVIQCRDRDLSVVLANNLNSNNAESGKNAFLADVAAGMEDLTIYWTDVHIIDLKQGAPSESNEYVNSRFLSKTPKTTTNGKAYFEYVYRVEFSVATDKPDHVSYFAHTYLDVCQMNEELDTDLPCYPKRLVPPAKGFLGVEDVMGAAFGDITQSHVIMNGLVRKTNLVFLTENQEVWSGPKYYLPDNTWSGTPEGTPDFDENGSPIAIPLTALKVPNTKVLDYRARDKMLKFPLDTTFINQTFFAPLEKTKAVGSTMSEVWGELGDPAYFSDMYISRDHKETISLVFSVDMSALFYYNSRYAAFTKSPIGNPIDQMIDAARIKNIKIYRKHVSSTGSQLDEELIAESDSDTGPGSLLTFYAPPKVEEFSSSGQPPPPLAIGIETPTHLKGNNYIRTFRIADNVKSKMSPNSYYQYRAELEFTDGGRDFLMSLLNTLNSGLLSLEGYYNAADVPGNFDHDTYRFKEDFVTNQKEFYIKEIIPTLATIDWVLRILPSSSIDEIPLDVSNILYSFSNPETGDISGIAAVRDIAAELVVVMSKLLGQAYSKTDKNSAYAQNKVTPSTKDIKHITQIKHDFSDTYYHRPFLGYTFVGQYKGTGTYTVSQEDQMEILNNLSNYVVPAEGLLQNFQENTDRLFVLDDDANTPSGIIDIENDGTYQNISFEGTKFSYLVPVSLTVPSSNADVSGGKEIPTKDIEYFTDKMVHGKDGPAAKQFYDLMAGLIIDNIAAGDPMKQDDLPVEKKFENFLADMGCTVEPMTSKIVKEGISPIIEKVLDLPQGEEDATDGTDGSLAGQGFGQALVAQMQMPLYKGLVNLIVTDDSWSDKFENSLDRYNLLKAGNAFSAFIGQPNQTDDFRIKLFNSLPNQIKSLFIGSRAEVDQVSYVKYNPYISLEGIDPFIDPATAITFFMNFVNIVEVQVLDSYLTSEILGGKQKRNYVSSPNWVRLTKNVMSQRTGERVLCRMVQWKDSDFGTDFKDKFFKLPIYNEYFYVDMPGPPLTQASPAPPYPSIQVDLLGEMANNMLGAGLAAELGEMEDISETAPATTLPGEPSEPSAGGGYF